MLLMSALALATEEDLIPNRFVILNHLPISVKAIWINIDRLIDIGLFVFD